MFFLFLEYNLVQFFIMSSAIIGVALLIDLIFGDPPLKIHPVVWMGSVISFLEKRLRNENPIIGKINSFILLLSSVVIFTAPIFFIFYFYWEIFHPFNFMELIIYIILSGLILKITFAVKCLRDYTYPIALALERGDIKKAREYLPYIVRRDPSKLTESGIISAAIESIAESTVDGITSPLFYFAIFGVPGAIAYRVVNTLDSMVGYKDPDKIIIGMISAKADDVLNYIPVRITFIIMIISSVFTNGAPRSGLKIALRDHTAVESPNAGWTMATMAGILMIQLKKEGYYTLGDLKVPLYPSHIKEALYLFYLTCIFFIFFTLTFSTLIFAVIKWLC
ncbi:MAG: cobalamin biosynthesis protein [Promethearchaeota archaeon]